ncbi:hypothetical protein [Bifidobacterium saguinibicoloris]|uniref:hypothetical protein n=1 Tax=Bifidobacterium saguinibicoloris TaxID=2834433 RepID=UPI001C5930C9|nr:hypothetical protein [Bifidobacterium saguinibicoloris]MBW3080155.1 hypothetical protein [Bifidobacterium saguinibicoloris]
MAGDLMRAMAGDLGIPRMHGEDDTRFACRVSYSALRFWIQAFCLDDGFGGSYGISQSTIIRKSEAWLRNLAGLYPDVLGWYAQDTGVRRNLSAIVRMLTNVRDIVGTNDGLYRCTARHAVPLGTDASLLLGLTDPTNLPDALPISGMAFAVGGTMPTQSASSIVGASQQSRQSKKRAVFTPTTDQRYIAIDLSRSPADSAQTSRFNLLTWPVSAVDDKSHRLARTAYGPTLAKLLESAGYVIVSQ